MRFSATLFLAALASTGVLAAPNSPRQADNDGIKLRLTEDGMVQRIAADGTLLGESKIPPGELEKFKSLAGQSQSQRRDDNVFAKRACSALGMACTEDSSCWFSGCDGCIFFSTNQGYCYGSIW
ncbi:hypothetical protein B0I37DRAFT_351250 [Chaetomium sp. MPI-CAGE-AT-0009]|nr:hypothetical protein B0I37DRAFT_351250 [Chaetomium sp. MPI-CAGE-AT-0009]